MELLEKLRNDSRLTFCAKCEENGVDVEVVAGVRYVIISPEAYYIRAKPEERPKMVDCFFVQHCDSNSYHFTIVELKNTRIKAQEIIDKFQQCIDRFMTKDFPEYFNRDCSITLYLVSQVTLEWEEEKLVGGTYTNRMRSLMNNTFSFRGIPLNIQPKNPAPLIQPC
ncbi:MAG: hypothetical protein JNN25_09030 [Candidatus Kapabacteria bacterium]|nr:hypothetical protein [Candidatus Kapabacteria bacterium]